MHMHACLKFQAPLIPFMRLMEVMVRLVQSKNAIKTSMRMNLILFFRSDLPLTLSIIRKPYLSAQSFAQSPSSAATCTRGTESTTDTAASGIAACHSHRHRCL